MVMFIVVLIFSLIYMKFFIKFLSKKNIVQPIYEDAPEIHQQKSGTLTMGGFPLITTVLLFSIIYGIFLSNYVNRLAYLLIFSVVICGYGFIGFRDDYLKITNRKNESGLTPIQKLVLQFLVSFIVIMILIANNFDTTLNFVLFSANFHNLYYLVIPVMIVGYSNASNLTDGLDGLLASISIIIFTILTLCAINLENSFIIYFNLILIASLLGFLFYNRNPAKIFMGDTGSLVIGAIFAVECILLKVEIVSLIIGFCYILEVVSVALQVLYFKYTKKKYGEGRRIFLMAPLHHHFEKKGIKERNVVLMFCVIQVVFSYVGYLIVIGG